MSAIRRHCVATVALIAAIAIGNLTQAASLDAFLAAGEFGPALQMALKQPTVEQRDEMHQRIALAQVAAGAKQAALATSAEIYDDQMRGSILSQIRSQPVRSHATRGGGTQADFQSLIDLITATIAPDTWEDVGGAGAVAPFPGGVYVDASGVLRKVASALEDGTLARVHRDAASVSENRNVRSISALRKVSLNRLEKAVQLRWAAGQQPTGAMASMAGLQSVQYVMVYPDTGDIVIAGPAGNWRGDSEGRQVSTDNGRPVLQLDDLVVLLRNAYTKEGRFGCSITPTKENLAAAQAYLNETGKRSLKPGERTKWLKGLRDKMGKQDIDVYGVDTESRVAQVLVEADYRMKLVGMGLEEGVVGVVSYLDGIKLAPGQAAPPMDVLRWWFTLNYSAVQSSKAHNAFAIQGPGVKVLSENELLTEQGDRVHTGKSGAMNSQFAHTFTKNFSQLAAKYPVYADLKNVFDLALVASLLKAEDLPGQANWHMTHFAKNHQIERGTTATQVDTVVNHRVINKKHVIAGVSGGVAVKAAEVVKRDALSTTNGGQLDAARHSHAPTALDANAWWWD